VGLLLREEELNVRKKRRKERRKRKGRKRKEKIWQIFQTQKFSGRKIKDNLWSWSKIIFVKEMNKPNYNSIKHRGLSLIKLKQID
jgi:hypothetical protein